MISYAEVLEDIVLARALRHVEAGFWIDVGAGHPHYHSATKMFSERGWRGINIEPVFEWFNELAKTRWRDINLNLAASSTDGVARLYEVAGTGLSTTVERYARRLEGLSIRTIDVPCSTISQICSEYVSGEIHFLKVDVEGAEGLVFAGCDFARFRPWIIVAEATEPLTTAPITNRGKIFCSRRTMSFRYLMDLTAFTSRPKETN